MCIGHDGIKFHEMKVGAFNSNEFVVFLQGLAVRFPEVLRGEVCLVMDNARIHHAQTARNFLVENGIRHIYLPPYSPDLNPHRKRLWGSEEALHEPGSRENPGPDDEANRRCHR